MYNSRIDVDQIIKNLIQVKMPQKQAKVLAKESHSGNYPEKIMKIHFEKITAQLEARIEKLRSDIFKWSIGILITQMTGIFCVLMER
jgi:hypothetical protein